LWAACGDVEEVWLRAERDGKRRRKVVVDERIRGLRSESRGVE
jgi:hypothetical protein